VEFDRYADESFVGGLSSPELAKSREFYGGLFGWNCPRGRRGGRVFVCDLGGKTVAGLGPVMNPGMPPSG